jgi:Gamma-glutamyl cyclotransferase, AIG2-like
MKDQILYFAYGSNVLRENIERRLGPVKFVDNIKLYGYCLTFNAGDLHRGRFANLTKRRNTSVTGTLYMITPAQLAYLDVIEGAPHFYTKVMYPIHRGDIIMYVAFGEDYVLPDSNLSTAMNPEYIRRLYYGYTQQGLIENLKLLTDHLIERKIDLQEVLKEVEKVKIKKKKGTKKRLKKV